MFVNKVNNKSLFSGTSANIAKWKLGIARNNLSVTREIDLKMPYNEK